MREKDRASSAARVEIEHGVEALEEERQVALLVVNGDDDGNNGTQAAHKIITNATIAFLRADAPSEPCFLKAKSTIKKPTSKPAKAP